VWEVVEGAGSHSRSSDLAVGVPEDLVAWRIVRVSTWRAVRTPVRQAAVSSPIFVGVISGLSSS
jgi:hypothetical protein